MTNVTRFNVPPLELCTVRIVRLPDHAIGVELVHMPDGVMIAESAGAEPGGEASERLRSVSMWLRDAADDMLRQAREIDV